jgi:prepilin-type N-terminal cleavage/methylation domain-containing protein
MKQFSVPRQPMRDRRGSRGFTLIEVMITVAIIAILAGIAVPNYRDYVLRGQLVEGTNALSAMRADMERFFQDNRSYLKTGDFVPPCTASDAKPNNFGTFKLTCSASTATSYTLQAAGSGATNGFVFKINQLGVQSTEITGVSGWSGCTKAWITKRGQACPT